jgi:hypothetical protein
VINAQVVGYSEQPARELSALVELLEVLERSNKGFLGQIPSVFLVLDHPPNDSVDRALVSGQEDLIGPLIVLQAAPDEVPIFDLV